METINRLYEAVKLLFSVISFSLIFGSWMFIKKLANNFPNWLFSALSPIENSTSLQVAKTVSPRLVYLFLIDDRL